MLRELIDTLTDQQRAALRGHKIERQLLHRWKHGFSHPTELQVVHLVQVTGANWHELQAEATVMRAPEQDREAIAKTIGWNYTPRPETHGFRAAGRPESAAGSA